MPPAAGPDFFDVCIIGGGVAGCIVARDVASAGLRSVILERDASVGGVWRCNDYQGLRLHGLAAPYRSWTLAPPWQKEANSDNLYRPTKAEILEYIHTLVDHELIVVRANTEYVEHGELYADSECGNGHVGRMYRVTCQNLTTGQSKIVQSRVVVFATGTAATLGGVPNIPVDLKKVTNGAHAIHSSQMSSLDESILNEADNIYLIGSSKAAIDVMHHFMTYEQNLVPKTRWAHRGHMIFVNRESFEGWMISANPFYQRARSTLFHTGSWFLYHQFFLDPLSMALGSWKDMTNIGTPFAKMPYRGGVENKGVLDSIRSVFGPSQILLKQQQKSNEPSSKSLIVNSEGSIELHAQDGSIVLVKENDLIIFCTGQRRDPDKRLLPRNHPPLSPSFNSLGIFTVQGYTQMMTVNAVLTAGLIIAYLEETNETIYSSGYLTEQLCRIDEKLEGAKDKSAWAMTMSYLGGMFVCIQPSLTPNIIGDLVFHYRWQHEWFGRDLDLREDLLPLITLSTTCC
mmetsp:Transcript_35579/g.74992  ORF Transcript_35579/g.74992 Transcript_35579/m.74992 type:complete len:514 (-) Transcript_35579:210-1751(-)